MTKTASHNHAPVLSEGAVYQLAAEVATDTKRIIPADPAAIHQEEYGTLVVDGLVELSHQGEGQDYHGIDAATAQHYLKEHFPGVDQAA